MSTPEPRVSESLREMVEFAAREPWQFSPADARRIARLRRVAVAAQLGAMTKPSHRRSMGTWPHRMVIVVGR